MNKARRVIGPSQNCCILYVNRILLRARISHKNLLLNLLSSLFCIILEFKYIKDYQTSPKNNVTTTKN